MSLAAAIGDDGSARHFAALRDAFRQDIYDSIAATMEHHDIDYIPASVELGDFDPSSTSIAVSPVGELASLPQPALARTFQRYFDDLERRRLGGVGEGYSAYELRNVEALIRMGEREQAFALLRSLHRDRRPAAWNQWQEITWRDPTAPRFIGDMPHTWIGSSFIRALRAMLVYEREEDRTLVLAAGLPLAWVQSQDRVAVKGLPTHCGTLHYSLRREAPGVFRMRASGDLALPACRLVVEPPLPPGQTLRRVEQNGRAVDAFGPTQVEIPALPADLLLFVGDESGLPPGTEALAPPPARAG